MLVCPVCPEHSWGAWGLSEGTTAPHRPKLPQQASEKLRPGSPATGQGPVQEGMWHHSIPPETQTGWEHGLGRGASTRADHGHVPLAPLWAKRGPSGARCGARKGGPLSLPLLLGSTSWKRCWGDAGASECGARVTRGFTAGEHCRPGQGPQQPLPTPSWWVTLVQLSSDGALLFPSPTSECVYQGHTCTWQRFTGRRAEGAAGA